KADWERLGPETKQLMFGKELTSELDKFMLAAKRLTSPRNPSGSTHSMIAALCGLGAPGEIVRSLFAGNLPEAATIPATAVVLPNVTARLLLTPAGVRL